MRSLIAYISILISFQANALEFQNVSQDDLEKITNDFSGNFVYTTVSGASSLGAIFGVEAGIVFGFAKTPEVDKLVKENDSNADSSGLPHGGLVAALSVPFGITADLMMIPSMNAESGSFSSTGLGLKWTLTQGLITIPLIDIALKAHLTTTNFEYKQFVDGVDTKVSFDDSITGFQALVGLSIPVIKPYVGIGTLSAEGKLSVAGSQTIFDSTFTAGTSAKSKVTSAHTVIGAELSLLLIKLGLEYAKLFDTDRYTMKLALSF